jgi:molybdate transport system substrate-binding protein
MFKANLAVWGRFRQIALAAGLCLCLGGTARADELIVSAAISLVKAFKEIGEIFEQAQPQTKVVFNFAASGPLLQQIERGAPVDVLATADQDTMDRAAIKELIKPASRRTFAVNRLVLVVPAQQIGKINSVSDLKQDFVKRIAIGVPASVPAGRYARDALQAAGAWDALVPKFINAESVRQVMDYVSRGEVDAGFVYTTDAWGAGDRVRTVTDLATTKPVEYPIAVIATTRSPRLAEAFVAHVLSAQGRAILAKHRFGNP